MASRSCCSSTRRIHRSPAASTTCPREKLPSGPPGMDHANKLVARSPPPRLEDPLRLEELPGRAHRGERDAVRAAEAAAARRERNIVTIRMAPSASRRAARIEPRHDVPPVRDRCRSSSTRATPSSCRTSRDSARPGLTPTSSRSSGVSRHSTPCGLRTASRRRRAGRRLRGRRSGTRQENGGALQQHQEERHRTRRPGLRGRCRVQPRLPSLSQASGTNRKQQHDVRTRTRPTRSRPGARCIPS